MKNVNWKIISEPYSVPACEGCGHYKHFATNVKFCDYIGDMHTPRPCESGENCTEYTTEVYDGLDDD